MEPSFDRLPPLVETLAEVLTPCLTVPFAVFGHSMGALISFELARELRKRSGLGPTHLFVSGHRAPHLPDRDPPLHQLPESEFLQELQRLTSTPEEVMQNAEFMRLMLPTLRADFAACETYAHSFDHPLECSISAYGGTRDSRVTYDELSAWSYHTQNLFQVRVFDGDHFFLVGARKQLLQALTQDLLQILMWLKPG